MLLKTNKENKKNVKKKIKHLETKSIHAYLSMSKQSGHKNLIRNFGMKVDDETSASALKTADFIYSKINKPILNIAALKKELDEIPKLLSLIVIHYLRLRKLLV